MSNCNAHSIGVTSLLLVSLVEHTLKNIVLEFLVFIFCFFGFFCSILVHFIMILPNLLY